MAWPSPERRLRQGTNPEHRLSQGANDEGEILGLADDAENGGEPAFAAELGLEGCTGRRGGI